MTKHQQGRGWLADYYAWGRRIRRHHDTREDAETAEHEDKRESRRSRTNDKLATAEPRDLRCGQARKDGTRCRREATDTHEKNGKPTCEKHQAR